MFKKPIICVSVVALVMLAFIVGFHTGAWAGRV